VRQYRGQIHLPQGQCPGSPSCKSEYSKITGAKPDIVSALLSGTAMLDQIVILAGVVPEKPKGASSAELLPASASL
jgi:hypothetical protein